MKRFSQAANRASLRGRVTHSNPVDDWESLPTKANIEQVADAIYEDLNVLAGNDVASGSWQDHAGTLANNMFVFAYALHEQRRGRMRFNGGAPTDNVHLILGES